MSDGHPWRRNLLVVLVTIGVAGAWIDPNTSWRVGGLVGLAIWSAAVGVVAVMPD